MPESEDDDDDFKIALYYLFNALSVQNRMCIKRTTPSFVAERLFFSVVYSRST